MLAKLPPLVRAGYVSITDCAPLIVAQELGFDRQHGIRLEAIPLTSWTGIRDGLAFEQLECAHMPGALALAMHLGLSGLRTAIHAPLLMGRGGNAITISAQLYDEARSLLGDADEPARPESAQLVHLVASHRRKTDGQKLRFGAVHPYSSHNYELRAWLAHAAVDPDADVDIVIIPRSKMIERLASGEIDGFCVGDPWGQMAVEAGLGHIVATKADLYPYSPEKVLAFRAPWVKGHSDLALRTTQAVMNGLDWASQAVNRKDLAYMLSAPDYLDVPYEVLLNALSSTPRLVPGGDPVSVEGYLDFSGDGLPTEAGALWLLAQMRRWGQAEKGMERDIEGVFAPLAAPEDAGVIQDNPVGEAPAKAAFDGVPFSVNDIEAYRRSFPIGYSRRA